MTAMRLQVPNRPADAFYLLAHDKNTGRPHQPMRITHMALGAAMLAELLLDGMIHIGSRNGTVRVNRSPLPPDLAQHIALAEIQAEEQPLQAWMHYLGPLVREPIARRLERAGYHQQQPARLRNVGFGYQLTRPARWRPTTPLLAETPALHLSNLFDRGAMLNNTDLTLAALTYAAGLHHVVFPYTAAVVSTRLQSELPLLPNPLQDTVRALEQAVDRAVAASRH